MKRIFIILVWMLGCGLAQARDTLPQFRFITYFNENNVRVITDTEQEAQDSIRAYYAANYPMLTITDFYPDPTSITYNGKPSSYSLHYIWSYDQKTYSDGAYVIDWECASPMQTTAVGGVVNNNAVIHCRAPTNIVTPDCDVCNSRNPAPAVGKPILPSTGVEQEIETDYRGGAANDLSFTRTYRSDTHRWIHNYDGFGIDYAAPPSPALQIPQNACFSGPGTETGIMRCLPYVGTGLANDFSLQRGNGRTLDFGTATDLSPTADINDRVTKILAKDGTIFGYSVYNSNSDATESYDTTGRLQSSTTRNGQVTTFTYSDSTTPVGGAPGPGLLMRVTDYFGRHLDFTYDGASRIVSMIDPDGGLYLYGYDEATSIVISGNGPGNNLTSVTYPDGKKRIYWYNEQDKTAGTNQPNAMTGITDENGVRYATIRYDNTGKAVSTELAGGVQKYSVSYPSLYAKSMVIDPLGTSRTYSYSSVFGLSTFTGVTQSSADGKSTVSTSLLYDSQGNVGISYDFKNNRTNYTYDLTRNLETSRTEAFGTAQARTVTTTWHPTFRIPLKIAEPKRITAFTYDAGGNVLTKTIQATTDATGTSGLSATTTGPIRTWSYTYTSLGQMLTSTGPTKDLTSYSYDDHGNLTSVTNAAGHVTNLSNYDPNGRVGRITDPNGLITDLTYTPRGWLSSRTVGGQVTNFGYDGVDQLTQVTFPDTSTINYVYDDAHRLISVADRLSNSIAYTLDNMGNRTAETVVDPTGVLARQTSRVYDALNRLQQQTGQ